MDAFEGRMKETGVKPGSGDAAQEAALVANKSVVAAEIKFVQGTAPQATSSLDIESDVIPDKAKDLLRSYLRQKLPLVGNPEQVKKNAIAHLETVWKIGKKFEQTTKLSDDDFIAAIETGLAKSLPESPGLILEDFLGNALKASDDFRRDLLNDAETRELVGALFALPDPILNIEVDIKDAAKFLLSSFKEEKPRVESEEVIILLASDPNYITQNPFYFLDPGSLIAEYEKSHIPQKISLETTSAYSSHPKLKKLALSILIEESLQNISEQQERESVFDAIDRCAADYAAVAKELRRLLNPPGKLSRLIDAFEKIGDPEEIDTSALLEASRLGKHAHSYTDRMVLRLFSPFLDAINEEIKRRNSIIHGILLETINSKETEKAPLKLNFRNASVIGIHSPVEILFNATENGRWINYGIFAPTRSKIKTRSELVAALATSSGVEASLSHETLDSAIRSTTARLCQKLNPILWGQEGILDLGRLTGFTLHPLTDIRYAFTSIDGHRSAEADQAEVFARIGIAIGNHLLRHKLLEVQNVKLVIPSPFGSTFEYDATGQVVSTLEALERLSPDEFKSLIKQSGEDIEIPSVTARSKANSGHEIASQEGAYEAMEQLRQSGLDSVLGKEMANKYLTVLSKIFIEDTLEKLGYGDISNSTNPLKALKESQKALASNFDSDSEIHAFVSKGYAMSWEKEKELIDSFMKSKNLPDSILGFSIQEYIERRESWEKLFDFAEKVGMSAFKRYSEIPPLTIDEFSSLGLRSLGGAIMPGDFSVSTAAKESFKVGKIDWVEFLKNMRGIATTPNTQEAINDAIKLGEKLLNELDEMSKGNIVDRALQIIRGEVAAVGKDVTSGTVRYYEAVRALFQTAVPVLHIDHENLRIGVTVTTREAALA